jgi:coproporphyrinogen III oxidase-like Fe-S oxidoreductase
MSYLIDTNYTNTFSLLEYHKRIADGKMGITKSTGADNSRTTAMRYTFATKLFGLCLDNREFKERYGVTVQRGLPLEMTFMKLVGALDRCDKDVVTLTPKGRYLLVALMRETLARSNDFRDQARAALSRDEYRELLEPPK